MKYKRLYFGAALLGIVGGFTIGTIFDRADSAETDSSYSIVESESAEETTEKPSPDETVSEEKPRVEDPTPSSEKPAETPSEKANDDSPQGPVSLCPRTAFKSQAAVDSGDLILWDDSPMWVAGHQNMGWDFLDAIRVGTRIEITCGPASGTYEAVGHKSHSAQGGKAPSWIYDYDLILQTCAGTGTGFTVAQKI